MASFVLLQPQTPELYALRCFPSFLGMLASFDTNGALQFLDGVPVNHGGYEFHQGAIITEVGLIMI